MLQNICFKCYINFEDVYAMFLLCYVCRKYFCIACYHKHHHNNTETQYENLLLTLECRGAYDTRSF